MTSAVPPKGMSVKGLDLGAGYRSSHTRHDPSGQASLLQNALQSDKVRIGCLLGAGCPLGIFDESGEKSLELIPNVRGLTDLVYAELCSRDVGRTMKLVPAWDELKQACDDGGETTLNVEHILTELRTLSARRGTTKVGNLTKDILTELDAEVCDIISGVMSRSLPAHRCSYHRLASWVGGLERAAPLELFTPNYDLLLEEAFEQQKIPLFDGFVGSREPFFDIASIEQDAIPRRWTRLWKLHGSINWERRADGTVFRRQGCADKGKAMIYPSHLKYDESRRMPYLAMIDRLRAFFRTGGHQHGFGPPVLVVCGYSFSDAHLNEVLLDGLRGNAGAQCFVLAYERLEDSEILVKLASGQPNMTVLAQDGAIVGTRLGQYSESSTQDPWIVKVAAFGTTSANGEASPTEVVKCRLGDFHFFGLFLELLYGGRKGGENDAYLV